MLGAAWYVLLAIVDQSMESLSYRMKLLYSLAPSSGGAGENALRGPVDRSTI